MWVTPQILPAAGPAYRFVRVATLETAAPGGGKYTFLFESYGVNKFNDLLFVTNVSTGGQGIFLRRLGKITQLVRAGQPAPGGGTLGAEDLLRASLNDAGDAAFSWMLEPSFTTPGGVNCGLYRYSNKDKETSAVVVPEVTDAPGGGKFAGVYHSTGLNNNGDIVFPGIVHGADINPNTAPGFAGLGTGVFRADKQNQLFRVVQPGDSAPGGKIFDWAANPTINDKGDIAFGAHVQGEECIGGEDQAAAIFCAESVYLRGAGGTIRSIAHQGDTAPGGGTFRLAFGAVINNRREIVFMGDLTPPPAAFQVYGVFLFTGGAVRVVARPGDTMPGGGTMITASTFNANYDLNNRGDVSFVIRLNEDKDGDGLNDTGLYTLTRSQAVSEEADGPRVKGTLKLVARSGTFIPSVGTIAYLGLAPFFPETQVPFAGGGIMNDSGRLLFFATTTDGKGVLLLAHPQG
jgi:hypothetical protein